MIGNVALPQGDREESGRGLQRQAKIFFFLPFAPGSGTALSYPGWRRGEREA